MSLHTVHDTNADSEQVIRDWQNFFMSQPFRIADYYIRQLMTEQQWLLSEKLQELPCKLRHTFVNLERS